MILDKIRANPMPKRFTIRNNKTSFVEIRRVDGGIQVIKRDIRNLYFTVMFTIQDYELSSDARWVIEYPKRGEVISEVYWTGLSNSISNTRNVQHIYFKGKAVKYISRKI